MALRFYLSGGPRPLMSSETAAVAKDDHRVHKREILKHPLTWSTSTSARQTDHNDHPQQEPRHTQQLCGEAGVVALRRRKAGGLRRGWAFRVRRLRSGEGAAKPDTLVGKNNCENKCCDVTQQIPRTKIKKLFVSLFTKIGLFSFHFRRRAACGLRGRNDGCTSHMPHTRTCW